MSKRLSGKAAIERRIKPLLGLSLKMPLVRKLIAAYLKIPPSKAKKAE
jgi:hypothetical protein